MGVNQPGENEQNTNQEPESTSEPDWKSLIDGNGKILGKWDKPEEVREGYFNLANQRADVERERDLFKEEVDLLRSVLQSGRANPAEQFRETPADRLNKLGIPVDDLISIVKEQSAKQMEPLTRTLEARSKVAEKFPDYPQKEAEIMGYIGRNRELSQTFNQLAEVNPHAALRWAIAEWKEGSASARQTASETTQAAKSAAALPSATGNAAMSRSPVNPNREKALQEAFDYFGATKDPAKFIDAWTEGQPLTWTDMLAASIKQR